MEGWIKLYRTLLEKPIWKLSTPEQKSILIALMLMANHEPNQWEWMGTKFTVKPGEFVTSLEGIVKICGKGITIQNVRTAIERFEKLEFLTSKSTKTGRLISILNWGYYQQGILNNNKDYNKEVTKDQQKVNIDLTTNKKDKNVKQENNENKLTKIPSLQEQFKFNNFIDLFNSITKRAFRGDQKSEKQFKARISEKYTEEDFIIAINNAANSAYLKENPTFLTPEFITRQDKLEKYLNASKTGSNSYTNNFIKQSNYGAYPTAAGSY